MRIGLGYVLGVKEEEVRALVVARDADGPFRSLADLASRAGAGRPSLEKLAWSGACDSLAPGGRRQALWEIGVTAPGLPLPGTGEAVSVAPATAAAGADGRTVSAGASAASTRRAVEAARRSADAVQLSLPLDVPAAPALAELGDWESMVADYATTGLTLDRHPMAILRPRLEGAATCRDLGTLGHGEHVRIGGLVVARQRPGTAKGIVFLLLEDEFGTINLIVPPDLYEQRRMVVRAEPLVLATGRLEKLERAGGAINVFVEDIAALEAPAGADVADVVELDERRPDERDHVDLGDFRSVAPPVLSFAAGRSR